MIKQTVTYEDFDGNTITETLYFHIVKSSVLLSSDEMYEKILGYAKELQERAVTIDEAQASMDPSDPANENTTLVSDTVRLVARMLDSIIDMAYGVKSEDGRKFLRNEQVLAEFKSSLAYEALLDVLLADPDAMLKFIENLTPSK